MAQKKPDYSLCRFCSHTQNIHQNGQFDCGAYQCDCPTFEPN